MRNKRSRLRGRKTCGWGSRKKHRGKGSTAGRGMSGSGKKAGQKTTFMLRYLPNYFGTKGFHHVRKEKLEAITLNEIVKQIDNFLKDGTAKKTSAGIELNLSGYKILSNGNIKEKLIIKASAASEKTKEKIEKAGGKLDLE
jgi:large subunit ribosomal protein L15